MGRVGQGSILKTDRQIKVKVCRLLSYLHAYHLVDDFLARFVYSVPAELHTV